MYRFLMVDDEEIVRRGFRNKIDWATLGFEFLEPCENGEQAIEALEASQPDVVMTDIAMPRMDGLGVAAYAAEHYPETVVVILSGYDEFEYAQRAIKSSVFEYVLKPVTSRDLTALLGRLRERLDARARTREEAKVIERQAEAAAALLKSRTLLGLVTGPGDALSAARFQELFGFSPEGLSCAVVIVDEGPAPAGESADTSALVSDVVAEVAGASRRALVFSPGERRQAVLVLEHDPSSCERLAGAIGGKVAAAVPEAIVGIGRPRGTWHGASTSFLEAAAALSCRLAAPGGEVFSYGRAVKDDPRILERLAERKERTRRAVVSGEEHDTEARAADYIALLGGPGVSPARVRHEVEALFASIMDALNELGVSPAAVARDLELDSDLAVQRLRTSADVLTLLRRLTAYAGSILDGRAIPAPEWKVRDFKEYVARHYGERDLSVRAIAASLSISTSYLSKLVKRHLDRSVVDYLVDY
ncbi:MAG TPA: response regulator, partial [Spirochaetia bacterium]|nr:response regulator [Spirochaetia bacterium]